MSSDGKKIKWWEACQILGYSKSTLYRLIAEGKIKTYGIGNRCRWFKREEINAVAKK